MMKKIFIIISIFVFWANTANAQFDMSQFNLNGATSLADELSIELAPTYPKPNSTVNVGLKMYTEDLNSSLITWIVNGKKVAEGRGEINQTINTPSSGSKLDITVYVTLQSGTTFTKSINLRLGEVYIAWESDSYTPPFYKGKALFPPQGEVRVSAFPELYSGSTKINSSKLNYKWTVNNQVEQSQSGYGKSSILLKGPILGTELNINLLVTDPVTNAVAQGNLNIKPNKPVIVFYENNPLYGIVYEKALNLGTTLKGEEVSVIASPFFLNTKDIIKYSWKMNGKSSNDVDGLSVTFRKPENVSGSTFVSLSAENQKNILQFSEGSFRINYSNE